MSVTSATDAAGRHAPRRSGGDGPANAVANVLRRLAKPVVRALVEVLCLLVRPRPGAALVYSAVPAEANGIEVVRWLDRHDWEQVTWLVGPTRDIARLRRLLGQGEGETKPLILSARDPRWVLRLAQSELFLFTHPLLEGIAPHGRRRRFVNLWHGDGPKVEAARTRPRRETAHFTVAGTRLWGPQTAAALNSGQPLICGNPRIDQYRRPATDPQLASLGIDPQRKLVMWAPTFRVGHHVHGGTVAHTSSTTPAFDELFRSLAQLHESCDRHGISLVMRPHPLDSVRYERFELVTVPDEQLLDCGVGLYQVLARAAAVVTDYSSIWTDFLPLDRPIALYCPDIDSYLSGFFAREGALEPSPSPVLTSVDELLTFLRLVGQGADAHSDQRARTGTELGAVLETGATERLMSAIGSPPGTTARDGSAVAALTSLRRSWWRT